MTPVTPTGSGPGDGGLPPHPSRAGVPLRHGAGVPRLPRAAAVAAGIRVPHLPRDRGMVYQAGAPDVRRLRAPGVGDGGHDLPGHAYVVGALVPCGVVGRQPEERRQRAWTPTGPRTGQLPHCMDLAPQTPTCDGPARPRPISGVESRPTRSCLVCSGSPRSSSAGCWAPTRARSAVSISTTTSTRCPTRRWCGACAARRRGTTTTGRGYLSEGNIPFVASAGDRPGPPRRRL